LTIPLLFYAMHTHIYLLFIATMSVENNSTVIQIGKTLFAQQLIFGAQ